MKRSPFFQPIMKVLHQVWKPELQTLTPKLSKSLGTLAAQSVVKEAWDLAVYEARGMNEMRVVSNLILFPALEKTAQALGQFLCATWKEQEQQANEAAVLLLQLGRSKLLVETRRQLKRARALMLLQKLGSALRRQDRGTAAWLAQSLQALGYTCEMAVAWQAGPKTQQVFA